MAGAERARAGYSAGTTRTAQARSAPSRRSPPPTAAPPRPPRLVPPLLSLLLLLVLASGTARGVSDEAGAPTTYHLEGTIVTDDVMPEIPLATVVTLDGGLYTGHVRQDGAFTIHNVLPGSYLFEALAVNYTFNRYRIDVAGAEGNAGSVRAYTMPHAVEWDTKGPAVPYPLRINAQRANKFFHEREGFNLVGMFANPMMLMMLVSVGLMFLGPKLMENMDPQALEEAKRSSTGTNPQVALPDLSQTLANMLAPKPGNGAGSGSSASPTPPSASGRPRRR